MLYTNYVNITIEVLSLKWLILLTYSNTVTISFVFSFHYLNFYLWFTTLVIKVALFSNQVVTVNLNQSYHNLI
uniref:Ovule protein n=1 Tax=Schistosoma mansoni TaxID=6183 RepID=A0A5K4F8L8_SCHMA